jgi:hypothetical protein
MNKLFLIVFSQEIDREELTKYFETIPDIGFWFYNLPYSLFFRADISADQIAELIKKKFGETPNFIITEIDYRKADLSGWIPDDHGKYFF